MVSWESSTSKMSLDKVAPTHVGKNRLIVLVEYS